MKEPKGKESSEGTKASEKLRRMSTDSIEPYRDTQTYKDDMTEFYNINYFFVILLFFVILILVFCFFRRK